MKLGFVGTGEITSAMVTGLSASSFAYTSIRLSPRNHQTAWNLAGRFADVLVAASNQDVLDCSEVVVIAVRPAAAPSVLRELRFERRHCVISLVSGLKLQALSELVAPAARLVRAVPLPSTARRSGPTGIYPPDELASALFASLGTVFPLQTEHEFEATCAATATIASVYAVMERITSWLTENGMPDQTAREYIGRMFCGLSCAAADEPSLSFQSLVKAHATAGGINELFLGHIADSGLLDGIPSGLASVMKRISGT